MYKPNFIVIGAGKAGSTSLCRLLAQHPHLFMSKPKEPRFFSLDENFCRGWEWYSSMFADATAALAIGEGSVNYTMRTAYPKTAKRIAHALPKVKLIYIVRHPLERIVSNWRMGASKDKNFMPFNQAIQEDSLRPVLVDRSRYWFQINAYRDYFPDNQILILFLDDLKSDPVEVLRRCFEFLGLDPVHELSNIDQAYNTAEQMHAKRQLLTTLRRIPMSGVVGHMLPEYLRNRMKTVLMREAPSVPEWDLDKKKWVLEQLIEDTQTFLEFYGKPLDFWSF